jgi:TIR domain
LINGEEGMADVFISYSKTDAQLTMDLARDLEARGYTTWWDTSLLPGDEFPAEIQHQINAAQAVIVIWTDASVSSRWVNAEANLAYGQNKLIATHAQGFNLGSVPLPFNTMQSSPVTDRAKIIDALAQRRVHPIRSVALTMPPNEYWAGQAATAQSSSLEHNTWQSVINAGLAADKMTAAKKYLKVFPNGVRASHARMILSLRLQCALLVLTSAMFGIFGWFGILLALRDLWSPSLFIGNTVGNVAIVGLGFIIFGTVPMLYVDLIYRKRIEILSNKAS